MKYTQLTREQRYQIYALKKKGHNQTEIADCIGVQKGTISRELKRNRGEKGYRPKQAHEKAVYCRNGKYSRIKAETWQRVKEKLQEDWSPEQISNWLKEKGIK